MVSICCWYCSLNCLHSHYLFLFVVVVDPLGGVRSLLVSFTALLCVFLLSILLFVAVVVVLDGKMVLYLMYKSGQSSSRVFPPANVRFHVDETVPKILLKSTNLVRPLRGNRCTGLHCTTVLPCTKHFQIGTRFQLICYQ